uniref:LIM and calponin homology domains 1b n=1 Tax=Cyprinus carpio carpio TaxID=630221 RepID=A0A9J8AAK5_CYPCA
TSNTEVTGRSFNDSDFRGGLVNGILLCELLNTIRPGLVKKINRLPTPVAALDNVALFLKGCLELGLKSSQLFDPGDLQDTSARSNKGPDNNKKLKNVLINIYWLGRAANSSTTYNGPTLDLHKFEGLLSQMRKEAEECDSPKRSIRDSGYIDRWESERSDSLSSPRHARDDSFDSLDSIGSRSHQIASPDGLLAHCYSDGHGSDSECDTPQRKMPDVRKDDMLVRRTSCSEPRNAIPFNQYLPNKSNQSSYIPAPVRCPCTDRDDSRKSWSNATSPVGGERPFRSVSMIDMRSEEETMLLPHSQVRHELMHNQYNKLKEEEDHWQDDLAKWKSRRRSVSQDLIKKEEERKMMERLLSGDGGSQRKKSIKTYREIVEEKERREQELHEAYWNARTPEEAASVLQRYAQRFTISEAVIERLKLPKLLERISPDILFSLSASSNPLQYLRQQSLPLVKFTSTVEARVTGYSTEHEFVGDVTVPSLRPKPYSSAAAEMRTAKVQPAQHFSLQSLLFKRKATVTQITTRYNQGMQNTISECTTRRTLKQMGYSNRRPHRVPLLSAKNRKRRLQFALVPPPVLNLVKRGEHFSWDPEEERKRQERWRQEQERKLQEKYQREKEKLKQEWEQAQKEVEEEERRYHEEVIFFLFTDLVFSVSQCMVRIFTTIQNITDTTDTIKLCSSCGHPLGKGAAMIIETLSLYFHIQCFKCGICKGQLGDTSTGTDVRIRNGLLNCHQCYIRSRSAGQPTTL